MSMYCSSLKDEFAEFFDDLRKANLFLLMRGH